MDDSPHNEPLPPTALYIRSKAELLLRLGLGKFLVVEKLEWPADDIDEQDIEMVQRGCEQILGGRGFTEEKHLYGLGISGFYMLMRLFGCTMIWQAALNHGSDFLDRIQFQRNETGDLFTMYNLVPKVI